MNTGGRAARFVLAMVLGLSVCGSAGIASKGGTGVDSSTTKSEPAPGFVTIGHIPASIDQLSIVAESAQVKIIRSAKTSDIIVATNQPRDWNVAGATVRQAALAKGRGGVAMLADKLGSRCIVNGKIYPLPAGPIKGGISLNQKDGVSIGGQKIEPIPGTDMPGISDGPDALEVTVPETFTGSLKIGAAMDSHIELSSWNGGTIEAYMMGQGSLTAGKLESLAKAVIDVNGSGKASIKDLSTKVLVANVSGSGKVDVAHGSAEMSNATIAGDGSINLKGNYKNLKQAVQGQGTISVSN